MYQSFVVLYVHIAKKISWEVKCIYLFFVSRKHYASNVLNVPTYGPRVAKSFCLASFYTRAQEFT
jgi:hypothetical protein